MFAIVYFLLPFARAQVPAKATTTTIPAINQTKPKAEIPKVLPKKIKPAEKGPVYSDPDKQYQSSEPVYEPPSNDKPTQPEMPLAPTKYFRSWKFAAGLGYTLLSYWQIKDNLSYVYNNAVGACANCTGNVLFSNVPALMFEAQYAPPDAFGFMGGMYYGFPQEIKKISLSGDAGETVAGIDITKPGAKVQTTLLYGNAVYRWARAFIPAGLSYGIFGADGGSASGGIGYQFGFGLQITDEFSVQWAYWQVPLSWSSSLNNFNTAFRNYTLDFKYILF